MTMQDAIAIAAFVLPIVGAVAIWLRARARDKRPTPATPDELAAFKAACDADMSGHGRNDKRGRR